jgi:hypothetical protein
MCRFLSKIEPDALYMGDVFTYSDVFPVRVFYDVLMFGLLDFLRCADGRHLRTSPLMASHFSPRKNEQKDKVVFSTPKYTNGLPFCPGKSRDVI